MKDKKDSQLRDLLLWTPIIVLATPYIIFIAPQFAGFKAYIVESGSMSPEIPTGSVIYTENVSSSQLEENDVIVFEPSNSDIPAERISHRIIEKKTQNNAYYFKTKGDSNPVADPGWTRGTNVKGKEVLTAPYLGKIIRTSREPVFILILFTTPTYFLVKEQIQELEIREGL